MVSMVRVGSARSNENGGINGGKPGDQKGGREVSTQDWYLHSKGWVVIRAKDRQVRELIAHNMESICANNNIGYCQEHRPSLTALAAGYGYDASRVTKPCETDCSEAVRVCCLYAGVKVASFNTANEVSTLRATGKFDILKDDKYCKKPDYVLRGDILVTRTKGHTVVVWTTGPKLLRRSRKRNPAGSRRAGPGGITTVIPASRYATTGTGIPMAGGTGLMALAQWSPTHGDRIRLASGITLALMVQWSPEGSCRLVMRSLLLARMGPCWRERSGAGAMSEGRLFWTGNDIKKVSLLIGQDNGRICLIQRQLSE